MKENKYVIAKRDSWKTAVILISVIIFCLILGSQLPGIFPSKDVIAENVDHRGIALENTGHSLILTGTLHITDKNEYLKVRIDYEEMDDELYAYRLKEIDSILSQFEIYFNKKLK